MPTREAILESLAEDGFDVEWEQLWSGKTWTHCSACHVAHDGNTALLVKSKDGRIKAEHVLCMNRHACRLRRDGKMPDPDSAGLEELVVL